MGSMILIPQHLKGNNAKHVIHLRTLQETYSGTKHSSPEYQKHAVSYIHALQQPSETNCAREQDDQKARYVVIHHCSFML